MICPKCGTVLNDNAQFCAECGAQVYNYTEMNQTNSPSRTIKTYILVICMIATFLIGILFSQVVLSGNQSSLTVSSDKTFSTPEKLVEYYVDGLRTGDLQTMSEAFAVQTVSKKCDFSAYSQKLGVIIPMSSPNLLPTKYKQFSSMNEALILGNCIKAYEQILFGMKKVQLGKQYPVKKAEDAEAFEEKMNPNFLKNIKISTLKAMPESTSSKKNAQSTAKIYGADEVKYYNIVLECEGNTVTASPAMLLRYGKSWCLANSLIFH